MMVPCAHCGQDFDKRNNSAHCSVECRTWARVRKTDKCWLWTGSISPLGYGRFHQTPAHRMVFELVAGPIPEGLELDHLCRVRNCVNPAHLEPVTHRVNTLRSASPAALNAIKTHCPRGHEYTTANTRVDPRRGVRKCRTCHRDWERARQRIAA